MLFGKKTSGKIAGLEEKLAEAEQEKLLAWNLLDAVNNSAHLGIWTAYYNNAGEMERVHYSDEFRRMLGYTEEDLPDTIEALRDIIHPDETQAVFALYGAAEADRSGLTKFDINYRLLTKKGGYRWFRAMGECVRRPDRTPAVFIGTFSDIDEKVKMADAMTLDQRRQAAVDILMLEGTWSMDLTRYAIDDENAPMVFSGQFKKILGYSNSKDFPDIMRSWITKIHPDDVAAVSAAMGKQLSGAMGKTVMNLEYRMKHKDGKYCWVQASSVIVRAKDGKTPLMAAGTILDITERKENEMSFQERMALKTQTLRDGIATMAETVRLAAGRIRDIDKEQAEMSETAQKIGESVSASLSTVANIKYIADQTRLLSVNAYIEAARAGEGGKSFSVVASEVQSLAGSTQKITDNITDILTEMNASVKETLERIATIGEHVAAENREMSEIGQKIESLRVSATEISELASALSKAQEHRQ